MHWHLTALMVIALIVLVASTAGIAVLNVREEGWIKQIEEQLDREMHEPDPPDDISRQRAKHQTKLRKEWHK